MCLRGARSHQGCPLSLGALDLALAEGQVAPAHRLKFDLSICLVLLTSLVLGVVARGAGNPGKSSLF